MDWGVLDLTSYGNDLVAGGEFYLAGGNPALSVARWDGTSWSPLGAGTDDAVFALAPQQERLFAGGYFTHAGDAPANYVAAWEDQSTAVRGPARAVPLALQVLPCPTRGPCRISFARRSSGVVSAQIVNALGQVVRSLHAFAPTAGGCDLSFDGRDDAGMRLPAGIYLTRVRAGNETAAGRMVILN